MRCIPEEPEFGDGRPAEKAVWDALKNSLPDDVVLAHSAQVRDSQHEYEIDILVLRPGVGIDAIEVKGGQVSIADGQWYQSDRNGKHKIQSPVVQSQSSLHALNDWLEKQLGSRVSSRSVYMVSLPYTAVYNPGRRRRGSANAAACPPRPHEDPECRIGRRGNIQQDQGQVKNVADEHGTRTGIGVVNWQHGMHRRSGQVLAGQIAFEKPSVKECDVQLATTDHFLEFNSPPQRPSQNRPAAS